MCGVSKRTKSKWFQKSTYKTRPQFNVSSKFCCRTNMPWLVSFFIHICVIVLSRITSSFFSFIHCFFLSVCSLIVIILHFSRRWCNILTVDFASFFHIIPGFFPHQIVSNIIGYLFWCGNGQSIIFWCTVIDSGLVSAYTKFHVHFIRQYCI